MKCSRSQVRCKAQAIPEIKFEEHNTTLTSFAGLALIQRFFAALGLRNRIRTCFAAYRDHKVYDRATLFLQLIVHLLLGYRELRDVRYYADDPMVQRLLGLTQIPDASTLSRMLKDVSAETVERLRHLLRDMVLGRLVKVFPGRITLDFDGSVQSTRRHAQGTAVGYNKKKKGARSYYPLFCTIPQLGQVFDVLHRPGNVHDSNGAEAFVLACVAAVQRVLPHVTIEVRMDSAFFSDQLVEALRRAGVEFTISVPFERFAKLKGMIEKCSDWQRLDDETSYFETTWKPNRWDHSYRFLFIRTRVQKQQKGPIQLDLFVPHEFGYEFKVIVTNKTVGANAAVTYHEGRGSQEAVFGELKTTCQLGYIPVRRLHGNQTYLLAGLFAHNLMRELQMQHSEPVRHTTYRRATLWVFERLDTIRKTLIQRAGRLTRPQGRLTLTIGGGDWVKTRYEEIQAVLR